MPKSRHVEAKLRRLRTIADAAPSAEVLAELAQALADPSNLVIAAAAQIVGKRGFGELATDMVSAFECCLTEPEETDKQCRAKIAIAEALNKIEYDKAGVFLRGIHHRQHDGVWGDEDPGAHLRANCAFALVRVRHADALLHLTDLLLD